MPDWHSFDVNYREALAIQESLRARLILDEDRRLPIETIAAADISCALNSDLFFAAVVVHTYPELQVIEEAYAAHRATFPYIPGLLTFREGPPLLAAFAKLRSAPDVVIFDGQGIAHPRSLGLASHMGLLLDTPSIGCAKTRLWGSFSEPGQKAGDHTPLTHEDSIIGAVVRTRTGVKPLFVSQGHRVSLPQAVEMVISTCRGYRLPEPVRNAHLAVNRFRQSHVQGL